MRVAALDLGSNTTLLLIAEVAGGKIQKVLTDESTVTKLGQGVHKSRRFHPDALQRVDEALGRYRKTIDQLKPDKVVAVATSAARDVQNSSDLMDICNKHGFALQIISGDREAQLTFFGAVSDMPDRDGVAVIDVGGGSTELIIQSGPQLNGVSVDVGSVRLTDLFITKNPIPAAELAAAEAYAAEKFAVAKPRLQGLRAKRVIGVAGTPTTLAALERNEPFSENHVHGFVLSVEQVEKWIATLAPLSIAEREKFRGLQPKRADVIVLGSVALRGAMRALECHELTVSVRGLRYGMILEADR